MRIFCRRVIMNNRALLREKGPLLLAVNHPNSFLDAVILETLFEQPVYSLARGDAFVNKTVSRILASLKILPVYRTSEGVENLSENYKTFAACKSIFRKNGVVLIFSEGRCINEWHLRPLKKGTARLAFSCWEEGIPLRVLPVALNYSSFRKFGKNIFIHFGRMIIQEDFAMQSGQGAKYLYFNNLLKEELQKGVFEIEADDKARKKQLLQIPVSVQKKVLLFVPALAGWLLHAPVYLPVKAVILSRTKHNDHYDSVFTGTMLFIYPAWLILLTSLLFVFTHSFWALLLAPVMPVTAWAYMQIANQTD
jgi:1-acyl-sn-glycerol-3-phosphate acyltransferase